MKLNISVLFYTIFIESIQSIIWINILWNFQICILLYKAGSYRFFPTWYSLHSNTSLKGTTGIKPLSHTFHAIPYIHSRHRIDNLVLDRLVISWPVGDNMETRDTHRPCIHGNAFCLTGHLPRDSIIRDSHPWEQGSWGQHGAHLGLTGPRWAPYWPPWTLLYGIAMKGPIVWALICDFVISLNMLLNRQLSCHVFEMPRGDFNLTAWGPGEELCYLQCRSKDIQLLQIFLGIYSQLTTGNRKQFSWNCN